VALSRFTVTATVTVPAGTPTAESNGYGLVSWAGASGAYAEGFPITFIKGQVVVANSSAGSSAAQLLYQAIGSGNLTPFRDGTDAVGHAALSN
jgi:hypothetical protein